MTPAARSLQLLRAIGYTADVVERFLHHVPPHGIRKDLFGLADVEAIAADHTLYVQATPAARLADHVAKCLAEPRLATLLACPTRRFEIWSWGLRGARGKRKVWTCRRLRAHSTGDGLVFAELGEGPATPEAEEAAS